MATATAAHHTSTSVAVSIACLGLVAALTIPAGRQFLNHIRAKRKQYEELSDPYEDEDGVATEESQEAYSDYLPRLILILASVVGCADALVAAVLTTSRSHLPLALEQWLQFATWVRTPERPKSYYLTASSYWSCSRSSTST